LEQRAKIRLDQLAHQMDSIKTQLSIAEASNQAAKAALIKEYNEHKATFDDYYAASDKDINDQVWKRLNPYIEEFGKEQNLHLIIGANGMGTVLYNDDYYDLTAKAVKYVNEKYEHGN
jgi:Skp family chaperone for outer membrane proteins